MSWCLHLCEVGATWVCRHFRCLVVWDTANSLWRSRPTCPDLFQNIEFHLEYIWPSHEHKALADCNFGFCNDSMHVQGMIYVIAPGAGWVQKYKELFKLDVASSVTVADCLNLGQWKSSQNLMYSPGMNTENWNGSWKSVEKCNFAGFFFFINAAPLYEVSPNLCNAFVPIRFRYILFSYPG